MAFTSSRRGGGGFDLTLDGMKSHVVAVIEGHELYVRTRNGRFDLHWVDPFGGDDEEQVGEDKIVAPLPGTVVAMLAEVGATLEKGAPILTLEVMKMEQTLRAPFAGVLKAIKCKVGDIVQEGVELAEVEPRPVDRHERFRGCRRSVTRDGRGEVALPTLPSAVRPHHQIGQEGRNLRHETQHHHRQPSSAARTAACPRSRR